MNNWNSNWVVFGMMIIKTKTKIKQKHHIEIGICPSPPYAKNCFSSAISILYLAINNT